MKININITLDINAEEWAERYDISTKEVREDVKTYVRHIVAEQLASISNDSDQ